MEGIKSIKEKKKHSKVRMFWFVKMLWTTNTLSLWENWNIIRIINNKDNSLNSMHRKMLVSTLKAIQQSYWSYWHKFCSPLLIYSNFKHITIFKPCDKADTISRFQKKSAFTCLLSLQLSYNKLVLLYWYTSE